MAVHFDKNASGSGAFQSMAMSLGVHSDGSADPQRGVSIYSLQLEIHLHIRTFTSAPRRSQIGHLQFARKNGVLVVPVAPDSVRLVATGYDEG